jgi:molecular chaperone GrpE
MTNSQPPQPEEPVQASEISDSPQMATISEEELNQIKKEVAEYKDKYIRQLAEMENMRKRLQKEKQEMIQYSIQNVIVDFLNPIDHYENALKFADQASDEVKHWALGFQMILSQFKDVLANNGVTGFQSTGMLFDPNLHEAVEMVATNDCPAGTVVSESVKGYKMGGKTIRPARVTVAMQVSKDEQKSINDKENNNQG